MAVAYLDTRKAALEAYLPELTRRSDFTEFWAGMRERTDAVALRPELVPVDYSSPRVRVDDVTYHGFDETPIRAWLIRPILPDLPEQIPCIISYPGFNGGRGSPSGYAHWTMMGIAVLSVDVREQRGETGNAAVYTHGSATSVATKGLLDREEYYYGAVYMDAVKAIDLLQQLPDIDPDRIIVSGISQGGGIATAVSALDDRPWLSLVDVPSNSNIERRTEIKIAPYSGTGAFAGVNEYLRRHPEHIDTVFETLSYFDTMNMADRITAPVVAAVGLDDTICPAECYFATFNRITAPKQMTIYPYCGHGDVSYAQREVQMRYIAERMER